MNKLKAVISSLKKDMEDIDIDSLIQMYSENLPVVGIAHNLNRTSYEVNKVLYALQLRRKKKHRQADYRMYLLQLDDANSPVVEIDNLQKELDFTYKALDSAESRLQSLSWEIKRRRKESRTDGLKQSMYYDILDNLLTRLKTTPIQEIKQTFILKGRDEVPEYGLIGIYGDMHLGEVVNANEVPNNEYNYEIAKARNDKFIDSILMNSRQSANLVLVDLKDNIKGVIHGGKDSTEGGVITSILEAVKLNVYMLSTFATVYDTVTLYTTGSNHERLDDFIKYDGKYLDYGRLIDQMTYIQLEAMQISNVKVVTTDFGLNMFNINGANIVAFHGDNIRTFRPWDNGQRSVLQDLCLSTYKVPYRHSINGHAHQFVCCHNQYNGLTLQNGTTVGANPYGLQNGMRYITPSQTILFIESDGSIQDIKALDLSN